MPYPPLTNAQLRSKMKKYLAQFNDEGVTITDQTQHNEVLASDDGPNAQMSSQFEPVIPRIKTGAGQPSGKPVKSRGGHAGSISFS